MKNSVFSNEEIESISYVHFGPDHVLINVSLLSKVQIVNFFDRFGRQTFLVLIESFIHYTYLDIDTVGQNI